MALPTAILSNFKIQGQTAASAAINTVVVSYYGDGTWEFQDAQGFTHVYRGDEDQVNKLLELLFVGTGGLPVGTKLFGVA